MEKDSSFLCALDKSVACGITKESSSCMMQHCCPLIRDIKGAKLIYCFFDGDLCSGLVKDDASGLVALCRDWDFDSRIDFRCERFDLRFLRILLKVLDVESLDGCEVQKGAV